MNINLKLMNITDINKLIRTKVKKPRTLPKYGSGGLHEEQQSCYELGYREGAAALRKAMREKIRENK